MPDHANPLPNDAPAPGKNLQKIASLISELFGGSGDTLQRILEKLHWKDLPGGQVLFREGDPGDSLYILVTGRLRAVIQEGTPGEKMVGEIYKGEWVGEMALITGDTRSATVVAVRDSTLLRLAKADFLSLIAQSPELVMNISRLIINRYVSLAHSLKAPAKAFNIALIPTTDSVDMADFTQQLLDSFAKIGKTAHLNRQIVERQVSQKVEEEDANFYLSNWLTELEIQQNFILYEGALHDPEWTNRCLRQADKIIFIKDTQTGPDLAEVEKEVLSPHRTGYVQTREIVFLYPADTEQPDLSQKFLVKREVDRHYNIRLNDPRHMDRLARMITGRGIGLVLSGGGARGLAHIGIYQALRENNIPIDMVAGTSIGGILAAGMAMEWTMDKFLQVCRTAFLQDKPLADYTLPIVSLLKGKKLKNTNQKHFQNHYMEDLWLNYFCISGNYSTAEMVIHENGPIWKAITATASIPGVLPPVVEGNYLLIDGGILNNFPADVMHTKFGGKIIGIDLKIYKEYQLNYDEVPGGWYLFFSKFFPFFKKHKIPGIASIMMNTSLLASASHQKDLMQYMDWYMNPPVEAYSLLNLERYDAIVKTGYTYAQEYLKTADTSKLFD